MQVACHSEMFQVANELMIIADGNELYIVDLEHLGFKSGKLRTLWMDPLLLKCRSPFLSQVQQAIV